MATVTTHATPSKAAIYNDPRYRALFYQAVLLVVVLGAGWYLYSNLVGNMEQRGIPTGFDVLDRPAGFGIIFKLVPYSDSTSTYWRVYVVGLLNTVFVSFIGIILATMLGFAVGVARLSTNWIIARLATIFVETFRNIPLLLQIFFWYKVVLEPLPGPREAISMFGSIFISNRGIQLPTATPLFGTYVVLALFAFGILTTIAVARWARIRQAATGQQFPVAGVGAFLIFGFPVLLFVLWSVFSGVPLDFDLPKQEGFGFVGGTSIPPEFFALLIALTIYTASYIAEIVRAGILAVSHGQTEAAFALGLKPKATQKLIIVPQALRVIIPPLTNQYLNLTKNSSLAVAIAYPDLTGAFLGTAGNQTGAHVQFVAIAMATYLSFSLLTSAIMNWYNSSKALVER